LISDRSIPEDSISNSLHLLQVLLKDSKIKNERRKENISKYNFQTLKIPEKT
jgi:hypothetical protein